MRERCVHEANVGSVEPFRQTGSKSAGVGEEVTLSSEIPDVNDTGKGKLGQS